MASSEIEARRTRMAGDLSRAIGGLGKAARRNYYATFVLALIGVGASILAGIMAFLEANKVVVGVVALLPAAATILIGRLKLQERANWHYGKHDALLALYNRLHFELPDPVTAESLADVSRRWSALNEERAGAWTSTLALSTEELRSTAAQHRTPAVIPQVDDTRPPA